MQHSVNIRHSRQFQNLRVGVMLEGTDATDTIDQFCMREQGGTHISTIAILKYRIWGKKITDSISMQ